MKRNRLRLGSCIAGIVLAASLPMVGRAQEANLAFPPFEQWKDAVVTANAGALTGMYSQSPPAQIKTSMGGVGSKDDISFWIGLKPQGLKLEVVESQVMQPGVEEILARAEFHPAGERVHYFSVEQVWQQQGSPWRLVIAKRTAPTLLQLPLSVNNKIYPAMGAREEIQQALAEAAKKHERVLVVFGADWCYDCHVLDAAFHRPDLAAALQGKFEVVHVDVGEGEKNQDLMDEYRVPMKKGIPALAVLESDGKLLYSQQNGEFENARALGPDDLLRFLNRWKPAAR